MAFSRSIRAITEKLRKTSHRNFGSITHEEMIELGIVDKPTEIFDRKLKQVQVRFETFKRVVLMKM